MPTTSPHHQPHGTAFPTGIQRHPPPHQRQRVNNDSVAKGFQLQYEHPNGKLFQGNSIDWLASLDDASVDLVFADPPYNIKKADWDSFESQEHYIAWSIQWISQASRVLKPAGSLYVCGFSEILADLKHPNTSKP